MSLTKLSKRVDELFVDWSTARRTPGAVVRVICNGRVIHSGHYGLADIGKNIAIDTLTSFRLASLTKQFTAVAIMMLGERKLLGYDDPLSKFLPDFKGDVGGITIRQLLWHTSGLPEYEDLFRDTGVIDKDYPRTETSKPSLKEPTSKETRQLLS